MHRNKAKPEIWNALKIEKFDLHHNMAKLGRFSLALLPCTSVWWFLGLKAYKLKFWIFIKSKKVRF